MPYRCILDIPVYRCDEKQHALELDIEKRRLRTLTCPNWREADSKLLEENSRSIGSDLYYCWEFNEIVGWIRLEVFGSLSNLQFRGKYYWITGKRIKRKPRKKIFREQGNIIEFSIDPKEGSKRIFRKITRRLEDLSNKQRFKGRHVDLESYKLVGQFINWRRLMNTLAWK